MNDQRRAVQILREHRHRKEERLQQTDAPLAQTDAPLVETTAPIREPALRHSGQLASAVTAWVGLTFLVSYIALPLVRIAAGASSASVASLTYNAQASFIGLLGVLALTLFGLGVTRPAARLNVDPDRVLAATSGGLLTWGLLHNILPGLIPFGAMGGVELGTFLASNVIEAGLFGVMLASLTRTGRGAFTLGVVFQTALLMFSYIAMYAPILF
ncbi:MAG: hypothetical protein AAFV53_13400 [Myxococcota bacterium]